MALMSTWLSCIIFISAVHVSVLGGSLLCGVSEEVKLQRDGRASAHSLMLVSAKDSLVSPPCTLKVIAPDNHAISIRIIESPKISLLDELSVNRGNKKKVEKLTNVDGKNKTTPDCVLNVFELNKDSKLPIWNRSLCNPRFFSRHSTSQMLQGPLSVEWWPPRQHRRINHLRLVITLINRGEACEAADQVKCYLPGLDQLCVSRDLECDSIPHCPMNSLGDEENCHTGGWLVETVKRIASNYGELLKIVTVNSSQPEEVPETVVETTKKSKEKNPKEIMNPLEAALAPYGPWGYLILGILLSGALLMFCGIWECFCRHSKPSPQVPVPPDCLAPAAVLGAPSPPPARPPPAYDELEPPPPSYSVLFPRHKILPPAVVQGTFSDASSSA